VKKSRNERERGGDLGRLRRELPIAGASDALLQGWSARMEDLVDKDDHDGAP